MSAAPDRPDTATEVEEVERVARAMADVDGVDWDSELTQRIGTRDWYLRYAAAALAARRPATETEQAVERCRLLADEYERRGRLNADPTSLDSRVHQMAADRIRAALGGAARDGDGQ